MSEFAAPQRITNPNALTRGNGISPVQYGSDDGLVAEFYTEAVLMEAATEKAGKPVYEEQEFVHIFLPGAKTDLVRRVKLEDDGRSPPDPIRFPRQWAAFKNRQEQATTGWPIEQCAWIKKSQVMDLKSHKIHTVETLANLPDTALANLPMGTRELRDMARSVLKSAQDTSEVTQLRAELAKRDADIEALKQQFAEFAKSNKKEK